MITLIIIAAMIFLMLFPALRCLTLNLWRAFPYGINDIIRYIFKKGYNECHTGKIVAICGLFGRGKTLTAVHIITKLYKKKNNKIVWCKRRKKFVKQKILILSNVDLKVPYERLTGLKQIVECATHNKAVDDINDTLTVTLVLGDEFSVQMNSRSFKTNIDPLFLNTILTCRHHYISLYYTAQRFGHVDALLRQVSSYVIECNKTWRLQRLNYYDAWQLENASSPELIKPYKRSCWFVSNKDYNAYDTLACVSNLTKSVNENDMMSENEILTSRLSNTDGNQIITPSRKFIKIKKKVS